MFHTYQKTQHMSQEWTTPIDRQHRQFLKPLDNSELLGNNGRKGVKNVVSSIVTGKC